MPGTSDRYKLFGDGDTAQIIDPRGNAIALAYEAQIIVDVLNAQRTANSDLLAECDAQQADAKYWRAAAHAMLKHDGPGLIQASAPIHVFRERLRQIREKGYTPDHDDAYTNGELADAAIAYIEPDELALKWPWAPDTFKPEGERRNLERAAALLIAEIERLDRAEGR